MQIRLKRAYDEPGSQDGTRILVDRVWPRGVSKDRARIHAWIKDVAPSTELRKWFSHDPQKWPAFEQYYFRELDKKPEAVRQLRDAANGRRVTLVFAAKDREHNNAVALKDYLHSRG